MSKEAVLSGQVLDQLYNAFKPTTQEARAEDKAAEVYQIINGYADFKNLSAAIEAYGAATERRGFNEGFLTGMEICVAMMARRKSEPMKREGRDGNIPN